jgi:pimeloyl-ACP methyl ester carboxylesterase
MTRTRQRAYQDNIALEDCATATKAADEAARQWILNKGSHFKLNGEGGFSIFLDRLQCEIDQRNFVAGGRPVRVELYFFGHSMGALVGNELLWRHPDLPWRRIVYMAAATSVRDFRLTVAPMLECPATAGPGSAAASKPCRANVHFYGLMLHPLADAHELGANGLVPQGSLIEWVDEMFGHAASKDDRMFGKWANVEDTLSLLPPDTRDRMFFRVFPAQQRMQHGDEAERRVFALECTAAAIGPAAGAPAERCTPVAHGQFTDYSFWRPYFLCGYQNPCAALDVEPAVDPAASPPAAGLSVR